MRLFIAVDDLSDGGPIWINSLIPMLAVFSECFEVTVLQAPAKERPRARLPARYERWRTLEATRRSWCSEVRGALDADGPNVLMVWGDAVHWSRALWPVWDLFSHRVLYVLDTLEPGDIGPGIASRFDLVACFCADLEARHVAATGLPTLFFPAHADTLRHHWAGAYRPLDMLISGRRDDRHHLPLFLHFNRPDVDRVFVDVMSRGQTPMSRAQEFALLASTYAKAASAFCYEPSGVPRFRGGSPLLERWVHAWMSGCTVFGTRPRGRATDVLMDWADSTIELPDDPQAAIDLVEETLSDAEGMARRRRGNVREAVRRHDTRLRIAELLAVLDLPRPPGLVTGLDRLAALEKELAQLSG